MENTFLARKANGEKILISELLAAPPSDEVLAELFPYSKNSKPHITQLGLKILKLRLDGKDNEEAGKELGLTRNQVEGRFQNIKAKFERGPIPDYIELDSPALRRLRGLEVTFTEGYMKLSELLRDMPSDQELKEFAIMRGNVPGFGTKRMLNHEDLILVQKKQTVKRNATIARELGVRPESVRFRLMWIQNVLKRKLGVQIDLPDLFPFEADEVG